MNAMNERAHAQSVFYPVRHKKRSAGFSLVELMVALLIGLILMGGMVQIFSATRAGYQLDEGLARIQENGRFAMDFLMRELRQAGNMGCLRTVTAVFNNLNSPGNAFGNLNVPVFGFEYTGTAPGQLWSAAASPANSTSGWNPALDTTLITNATPGTDAIVIRRLSNRGLRLAPPYNDSAQIFLSADDANKMNKGEIAVLTDCEKASVFQVTSVNNSGTNITHAASGSPGNSCIVWGVTPSCQPGEQQYGPDAELHTLQTVVYFIAQGANGRPALWQGSIQSSPTGNGSSTFVRNEIVEGVENMQILYGVDTDGGAQVDGDPDTYMTATQVNNGNLWPRVVSVRVSLLMASSNVTGTATDTVKDTETYRLGGEVDGNAVRVNLAAPDNLRRRVFDATIILRNRGV